MKKHLLIAVLILAVITSLTAGTFAAYTATLETGPASVKGSRFTLTPSAFTAFTNEQLAMSPGDKFLYKMTVKNDSEVNADIVATANLKSDGNLDDRLQLTLLNVDPGKTSFGSKTHTFSNVAPNGSAEFYVQVFWPYTRQDTEDNTAQGETATFTVSINGVGLNGNHVHGDT